MPARVTITSVLACRSLGGLLAFVALLATSGAGATVLYPRPLLADRAVGYLYVDFGNHALRGSAVIARNAHLLYSAAHMVLDGGRWARGYQFHPGYHAAPAPPQDGLRPRGFRYFTSYARDVRRFGQNDTRVFDHDLVVFYGEQRFGTPRPRTRNGAALLATRRLARRIVGYPARIDYTGAPGFHFQHATPYFRLAAPRVYGAYHHFRGVSTGGGASGGAVFVNDGKRDILAAILIAGTPQLAGVRVLDAAADTMATAALARVTGTSAKSAAVQVYRDTRAFLLPDAARRFAVRAVRVDVDAAIAGLALDTNITTTRRGDLEVYLRAPSGRTQWVTRRNGGNADDLHLARRDYTRRFAGVRSAGVWRLYLRDAVRRERARYHAFALRLVTR